MEHHGAALRGLTNDDELVEAVRRDPTSAPLEPRERALVSYAVKLTLDPGGMEEADLAPLRQAGLDDRAVLDLNLVVSYFAFVNRIAQGLGVEIEPGGPPHPSHD